MKQGDNADAALFGIGKYPTTNVIVLLEKTNFSLNSKAILGIVSPPLAKLTITVLDSNDNIKSTNSITSSPTGKNKFPLDLDGFPSGIYRAAVTSTNIQDSIKFSVGLEPGSGDISLVSVKNNFSPGESILIIGNTGGNSRLSISLIDPSGNVSSTTESFSDISGNFSTEELGIPYNAEFGTWKITAQSRLDSKTIDVNVNIPTAIGVTLKIEQAEFSIGNTIDIKGIALSNSNRLYIKIIDTNDQVITTLETPITSDNTFNVPWKIPGGIDTGAYIIEANDGQNKDTFQIFIL